MMNRKIIFIIALFCFSSIFAQIDSAAKISSFVDSSKTIIDSTKNDSISVINSNSVINSVIKKIDTINIPLFSPNKLNEQNNGLNLDSINILKYVNYWTIIRIIFLLVLGLIFNRIIDIIRKNKKVKTSIPFLFVFITSLKVLLWITIAYLVSYQIFSKTTEFILIFVIIVLVFIGIALIDLLKNLTGGFYLSIKIPFEKGDYISIKNHTGIVEEIFWLNTKIVTDSGSEMNIPNSLFLIEPIKNVNKGEKEKQLSMEFSIPNNYDIAFIKKVILEAALSSPYMYVKKQPEVYLIKTDFILGVYSFKLLVFTIDTKFENELISSINIFVNNALKG